MADRDDFLQWVGTALYAAEHALHDGDAGSRRALWSRREPVSVLGARRNANGLREVDELFAAPAAGFSDCTDHRFELLTADAVGDLACTAGLEHVSASVDGLPRTYVLRVTQVHRREDGAWRVVHRRGDTATG
ncbi:nuclear transport factor 2 family protein [Streptomyces sp. NRRL B-24484]|uniref:nuclear transport factor 2 family protein n=1 Tax=Streptomyces sp. NRRL B-24484 TaxID=1463833 RepID=UPI0004C1BF84|nr:nuclear transport factor 2 family protein [Streptomyces sp. NRRL B-24484]